MDNKLSKGKMKKFDVIIVGAGPAGIFTALELTRKDPGRKILIIEKGQRIENRVCPKRRKGVCQSCRPCNITTGFSGAGAYSDGKLCLSPEIGGDLLDYVSYDKLAGLIKYVDDIYLAYGASPEIYGDEASREIIEELKQKAIQSNLKFLRSPIRHMGTEKSYEIYKKIQRELLDRGVEMIFNRSVKDLIVEKGAIRGVVADKEYHAPKVVVAIGREGADWLKRRCARHKIDTEVGVVDIGVRVEVRNEIMKKVNDSIYEGKFVYYTKTFDDKARTFCQNPAGIVAAEYYNDNLAVVNGHSYGDKIHRTNNTNFAILVSNHFTEPFREPIEYGKSVARLGNLLSGNKILVQRFGDFRRGRRTTEARLFRNNIRPTLADAVPGDLSLVLPYRIMLDIREMLEALDRIFPGMASDETLLYGVEVKFYSSKVMVDKNFRSNIKGLYMAGDGAGLTRGLVQASVNGVLIGRRMAGK